MVNRIEHKGDKNYTISLLRFIAMSFIVTCHFFQYYNNELAWWFNVGVQMFFCISGYLYGSKKISSTITFISKSYKKILIPAIALYLIFHREVLNIPTIIYSLLTINTIDGLEHLWFISYILFCYLLTPYLQELANALKKLKWQVFLCVSTVIMLLGFIFSNALSFYFDFSRLFCYIFGYLGGVFLQTYKKNIFITLTCILTFLTVIMNAVRIYFNYINPYAFKLPNLFIEYSHALLGISIVFIFIILFNNIKKNAFLDFTDRYSFYIYIVHQLFILSPFTLLTLTTYTIFNWIVSIIAILLSALILKLIADNIEKVLTNATKFVKNHICN